MCLIINNCVLLLKIKRTHWPKPSQAAIYWGGSYKIFVFLKKGSRHAKISFLHEHKSYKPKYPHFQLLDYIRETWRQQTASNEDPILTIPIVLYHGLKAWKLEPMESYFGDLEADSLRFLPSFDFIFINLQKYSDEKIRALDSIFLQKSLLAFKHHLDKTYLQEHIVEIIFKGYDDEITEQNTHNK